MSITGGVSVMDKGRWSRVAILAINTFVLCTVSLSTCGVVAATASTGGGSGWSALSPLVASLPQKNGRNLPIPQLTTSSSTTTTPSKCSHKKLFGRYRDVAEELHSCNVKRSSTEGDGWRFRGWERRKASDPTTTTNSNAHGRNGRTRNRLSVGWVNAEQQPTQAKDGATLSRKVIGVREAAAATGVAREGEKVAPTLESSLQKLRDGRGGTGWVKRFQPRARATSSRDKTTIRQQQQQQQQQHGEGRVRKETTLRAPSPSRKRSADPKEVPAAPSSVASASSATPVPCYLQWPAHQRKNADDAKRGKDGEEGAPDGRARDINTPTMGAGRQAGQSGSSDEASASSSAGEKSLGAAKSSRGGGGAGAVSLTFKEAMFAGAISRSIAQTCMQPANVVKTLLQGRGTASQLSNLSFKLLTRGAGAQFVMSLPHGAFNYATLEVILGCSSKIFPDEWRERAGPALDFLSSSVATVVCSIVSTPQMVLTDRIMAGMYPNLVSGVREIVRTEGVSGFYTGWSANVAQKIPSYGLTWVFFQQFKRLHRKATDRPPTNTENFVLGAAAAGATVCIMIPMDTVKTRLVTQTAQAGVVPYKGVLQTLSRIVKEEGIGPIYRSLTPRLVSVVPMIGIQFGIYEFVRKELMSRKDEGHQPRMWLPPAVRETLREGVSRGAVQHDYFKDFLRNVYLMEEELT